jgi:SAM-dependent methyltransferase
MFLRSVLGKCLNLPELIRHARQKVDRSAQWDPAQDIDLKLYAKVFENEFLHYGYFSPIPENAERISLHDIKQAMHAYAELITSRIHPGEVVLDVGCGTGGLLRLLHENEVLATGLTPNISQYEYIRSRYPGIPVLRSELEKLESAELEGRFDVIVNAESFQYIGIDPGMQKIRSMLKDEGTWLVIDYYRLRADTHNKSGHLLEDFVDGLARNRLAIEETLDITANALPTLSYAQLLVTRFGLPLLDHAVEKFFLLHPLVRYLLGDVVDHHRGRIKLDTLDPEVFARDKRYLLHRIRKS